MVKEKKTMSKRFILGTTIATLALGIFGINSVFAASGEIDYRGPNGTSPVAQPADGEGLGLMEDYLVEYIAAQVNVSTDEINEQLDSGLTLSQILINYGITDYQSVINAAHTYALEKLAEDGINIPGRQNSMNGTGLGNANQVNRNGRYSQ